jgi:polyisoprenoid-binding protein YceI
MQFISRTLLTIVMTAITLSPAHLWASESYAIDREHTFVTFKIKHLNVGNAHGRFKGPAGTFVWDDTNIANSQFEVTVQAADVDTDNDKRDKHLRSADFFDVARYSTITFKSTGVKKTGDNRYDVSGQLTLLGRSRPITVAAMQTGHGQDPWGNYRRGFETTFTIKRSQWGMDFMQNGLSDEVEITVSIEGVRQ